MVANAAQERNAKNDSGSLREILNVAVRAREARGLDATLDAAASGLEPLGVELFFATLEGQNLRRSRPPVPGALRTISLSSCTVAQECLQRRSVLAVSEMGTSLAELAGPMAEATGGTTLGARPAWLCSVWVHDQPSALVGLHANTGTLLDPSALALLALQLGAALEAALTAERAAWRNAALRALAVAGTESVSERLIAALLAVVAEACQCECAAFYLLAPNGTELVLLGSHGVEAHLIDKYQRVAYPHSNNGRVAQSRIAQAFHLRDWKEGPLQDLAEHGFTEQGIIPLHSQGRSVGTLNLARTTARPFRQDELGFATLLAEQIAVQLENNRLFADAQRQLRQLSLLFELSRIGAEKRELGPMINGLVERTALTLFADSGLLYLLKGDRMVLTGEYAVQPDQTGRFEAFRDLPFEEAGVSARAVLERKTFIMDQATFPYLSQNGLSLVIVTPLMAKSDRAMGALVLTRRSPQPFDSHEVELLESCAGLFAAAIGRSLLLESERQRTQVLEALTELGGLIANQLDLAEVSRSALRHLARLCDVPNCFLFLTDAEGKTATLTATNRDEIASELVLNLDDPNIVGYALRERRPVVVHDAQTDPHVSRTLALRFGHRTVMAVPLISDGRSLGAIILAETRAGRRLSESDVERAVSVSSQLAVAITNAQLYNDLQRSYYDLGRAQEALVRRERLAAVGELAALVAHEVRNPLAVIFNSIASLRRILPSTDEGDMLLGIVSQEAERLNQLVGDFLDFARPNEPDVQLGALLPVMEAAVEAATGTYEGVPVEIRFEVAAPPPPIPFDPRLLRQAFVNLVVNALQAMPKGGRATLRVTQEDHRGHAHVRVDISDTGLGIPEGIRARLFQPFFTTKASGTGLGLAVVKRIVEAHRGEVTVASAPGSGATFTLWLPLAADATHNDT